MQPLARHIVGHTGWSYNWQTKGLADSIAFGELDDATPIIVCPHVDRMIRVVAADSEREVCAPLAGHGDFVFSVRFGRLNGRPTCVSASHDRSVRIWDLERFPGRCRESTERFPCRVAASHARAPYIQVKTAITSGQQLAAFIADAPAFCCEIDAYGQTVIAGDQSGAIHILRPVSASG